MRARSKDFVWQTSLTQETDKPSAERSLGKYCQALLRDLSLGSAQRPTILPVGRRSK